MVTVTDDCSKPPTHNMEGSDHTESQNRDSEVASQPHMDPAKALHNFRSMADLIKNKDLPHTVEAELDDVSPSKESNRNDENENNVQDLRMNGHHHMGGHLDSIGSLREDHLRRWYSGDLGMRNTDSYNVDVDGESSHSGIPSDLSSDGGDHAQNGLLDDDEEMIDYEDSSKIQPLKGDIIKESCENEDIVTCNNGDLNISKNSTQSDIDNFSETGDIDVRKSKRKQSTPKPRDALRSPDELPTKVRRTEQNTFQEQLNFMQQQLKLMQEKLVCQVSDSLDKTNGFKYRPEMLEHSFMNFHNRDVPSSSETPRKNAFGVLGVRTDLNKCFDSKGQLEKSNVVQQSSPVYGDTPKDFAHLAKMLKDEFTQQVGTLVDTVVTKIAAASTSLNTSESSTKSSLPQSSPLGSGKTQHSPKLIHNDVSPVSCIKEKPVTPQNNNENNNKDKLFANTPSSNSSHMHHANTLHSSLGKPHMINLSPRIHQSMQQQHNSFNHRNNFMDNIKFPGFPFTHMTRPKLEHEKMDNKLEIPRPQKPKINDKLVNPYFDPARNFADFAARAPWFPPLPFHPYSHAPPSLHAAFPLGALAKEQEQTEALPLVVSSPKKKRTKVTDTRLSPRAARALLQEPVPAEQPLQSAAMAASLAAERKEHHQHMPPMSSSSFHSPLGIPVSLPTSVAIPNPSLQHSDVFGMYHHQQQQIQAQQEKAANGFLAARELHMGSSRSPPVRDDVSPSMSYTPSESPSMFKDSFDMKYDETSIDGFSLTTTLTPMHLRKAKLMFFFVRYPSSSILKIFFPDVKFNKNNTAQLVKWFSNFREFYYIQMEKYSRQALAEGVKNPEELVVTTDSELYRILNLHYNRNNQLEIPESFRVVVQATLREFFKAVQANKDTEQSWKKPIYKVIARMDDSVPDFFKSPNWMEQLNDI